MAFTVTDTSSAIVFLSQRPNTVTTKVGRHRLSLPLRRPPFFPKRCTSPNFLLLQPPLSSTLQISPNFVASSSSTISVENQSAFDIKDEISRLEALQSKLSRSRRLRDKLKLLDNDPLVREFFLSEDGKALDHFKLNREEVFLLKCVVAARQQHVLYQDMDWSYEDYSQTVRSTLKSAFYTLLKMIEKESSQADSSTHEGSDTIASLKKLLKMLAEVESFYDCIGGVIGYQKMVLQLLLTSDSPRTVSEFSSEGVSNDVNKKYYIPSGVDLFENTEYASQAALWGVEALPELAEIYPLGGSGDRLGLTDTATGECLPAALLPYCGLTLLEGLIRDLQAREFLYFKIFGKQCLTPVAIMTSSAKNNHRHIMVLCEKKGWFGRGKSNFLLFEQPQVPVVDAKDGQWLIRGALSPVVKPGGHGVIWKLAQKKGVFDWLKSHGRKGATVRQVSNVVASTDATLLALAGIGHHYKKKLGFASCNRSPTATEGINVLLEQKEPDGSWSYCVTCIEYTELDKLGTAYSPQLQSGLQGTYPANTNVLYVDLASVERTVSSNTSTCLPGLVLNLKKPISFRDHFGILHNVRGGRLECTMQNIADSFSNKFSSQHYYGVEEHLDTFLVHNERKRVTSSAKRRRKFTDKSLHQTPDGSFLDIMRNTYDILSSCNIIMPKVADNFQYLHMVPPFLILLHPALGPLWEVTRQKFQGGLIAHGSELQIEVAEFFWKNVELDGSLIIAAENVMGSRTDRSSVVHYGHRCGRCKLQKVKVVNRGIDWNNSDNTYWKHDVKRFESLKIVLLGNAEFEAVDVVLEGNHVYEVPSGYKMLITNGKAELVPIKREMMDCGSWFWKYNLNDSHISLEMVEL